MNVDRKQLAGKSYTELSDMAGELRKKILLLNYQKAGGASLGEYSKRGVELRVLKKGLSTVLTFITQKKKVLSKEGGDV